MPFTDATGPSKDEDWTATCTPGPISHNGKARRSPLLPCQAQSTSSNPVKFTIACSQRMFEAFRS